MVVRHRLGRSSSNAKPRRPKEERREQLAAELGANHPFKLYDTAHLAVLFDVDDATIWRWRKENILPAGVQMYPGGPIRWSHQQIAELLARKAQEVSND